jgi:hypothetical protein
MAVGKEPIITEIGRRNESAGKLWSFPYHQIMLPLKRIEALI